MSLWKWNISAFRNVVFLATLLCSAVVGLAQPAPSTHDIVLWAAEATVRVGTWTNVSDSGAASGTCIKDTGTTGSTVTAPAQTPANYFEMSFYAHGNTPYRLWLRMKGDTTNNVLADSVWVQFSNTVDYTRTNPMYRISSSNPTTGISVWLGDVDVVDANWAHHYPVGWGWNDAAGKTHNGPAVIFSNTGLQTIRVQRQQRGVMIDQIVLSPDKTSFLYTRPGAAKNDTRILGKQPGTAGPSSTLFASEGFGYSTSLNGGNGGTGFGGAWTAVTGNPAIAPGSMTYLTLPTSGNKVQPAVSQRSYRNFASAIPASGIKWVSFRINRTVTGALPGNHAGIGLYTGTAAAGQELFLGKPGFSTTNYGVDHTNQTPATLSGTPTDAQRDAFLIYKLDFQTTPGSILISMWRNPTSLASEAGLGATHLPVYTTTHSGGFNSMVVSTGGTSDSFQFDEFRIGSSFSDVTTAPGGNPPNNSDTVLDVMVWNIFRGRTCDLNPGSEDLQRHASHVAIRNPDVVCIQEYPSDATRQAKFLNHLRAVSGVNWHVVYRSTTSGASEGNAIVSSIPFVTTNQTDLIHGRSIVHGSIVYNGRTINLFSTHLNSGDSTADPERKDQVDAIVAWAGQFGSTSAPRLICGDFNMTSGNAALNGIKAGYDDDWLIAYNGSDAFSYPDNPVTTGTRTHKNRIDYIWHLKSSVGCTLASQSVIDTRDPETYRVGGGNAYMINTTSPTCVMGNLDDKGIRPSDHNMFIGRFNVN